MEKTSRLLLAFVALAVTSHAATYTVNTTASSGPGSLAQAVSDANANSEDDTITFASAIAGQTIQVTSLLNVSNRTITINGETNNVGMVLDANLSVRHFGVAAGATLNLFGVNLTRGLDTSGAGAVESSGILTATRCSFYGNQGSFGGAVSSFGSSLVLRHCTFQGNTASHAGGAVNCASGNVEITHCTITGNSAVNNGGGLNAGEVNLTLMGSIIAGNTAPSGGDLKTSTAATYTRSGQNIVRQVDAAVGTGPAVLDVDPMLAPLGDYGGQTRTCPPLPGSPAINPVGGATSSTFTTDQRFYPRMTEGPLRPGHTVDIGSVETHTRVSRGFNAAPLSFRGILRGLPAGFTVDFNSDFSGLVFDLGNSEVVISRSVTVDATDLPNPVGFFMDGIARHLRITSGATVTLRHLSFSGGGGRGGADDGSGGAIFNEGSLTVEYCGFFGNRADASFQRGGAIFTRGPLCVLDSCTFFNNSTTAAGGAVYSRTNLTGNVTRLIQCTLHGNTASQNGGALYNFDGLTEVIGCTITGNRSVNSTGGGISSYGDAGTQTRLRDSIVCENNGSDLTLAVNTTNSFSSLGYNLVGSGAGAANINGTGDTTGITDAQLAALGNYGGPFNTRPPLPGSPAIDKIPVARDYNLDQRGNPRAQNGDSVAGAESDIGATEAPSLAENNPGTIGFEKAVFTGRESSGTAELTFVRTGGLRGSVSVLLNGLTGTATAGTDYTALNGETVTLAHGQTTASFPISLNRDSLREQQETVNLQLAAGAVTTAQSTALFYILDSNDVTKPTATITAPAANRIYAEAAGSTIVLTGTAVDAIGLDRVEVRRVSPVDQSFPVTETFSNVFKNIAWSSTVTLLPGVNRFEVTAIDQNGNVSTVLTRSFTYDVVRPLAVSVSGPSNSGSVSAGFVPTSQRKSGVAYTITATARPGFVFSGWTGQNLENAGISGTRRELAVLNFTMVEGLTLQANFIPTPFPPLAAVYHGILEPEDTVEHQTTGHLSLNLTTTGSFTGTLRQGGGTHSVNGLLSTTGDARFGTTRASSLIITRRNLPVLEVSISMNFADSPRRMTATVVQEGETSSGILGRDHFSSTNKVPAGYAGTVSQRYHFITVPDAAANPTLALNKYPQGYSTCSLTLTAAGDVTCTGILADGTSITASGPLWQNLAFPLYAPLYTNMGCFASLIQLDTAPANSDLSGQYVIWTRPQQPLVQWYRDGWPEGLEVNLVGTKFTVPTAAALIAGTTPANAATGHLAMTFSDGLLTSPVVKGVNISSTQVITRAPTTDTSFTATLVKTTGILSGTFTHSDLTRPAYTSIILQKGANSGAYGHFMTVNPRVRNGLGEGGKVIVQPR